MQFVVKSTKVIVGCLLIIVIKLEQFVEYCVIAPDVKLGKNVKIFSFVNLYGCEIGDSTKIGTFVEIQKNAVVGRNCKISSHTFICEGVHIEDDVFGEPGDFEEEYKTPILQ